MKVLLGAFGDPGHAFPMIALGRGLRARGHEAWVEGDAPFVGVEFKAAAEYAKG